MSGHSLCLKPGLRRILLPSKKKKTQTNRNPNRRQDIFALQYIILYFSQICMLRLTYRRRNLVFFFVQNTYWCVCVNVCSMYLFLFSFFFFSLQIKASGTPTADEEEDDLTKMHRFIIIIIMCMLYKKTHVSFNHHHYNCWRLRLAFACLIARLYYFVIKNVNVRYIILSYKI